MSWQIFKGKIRIKITLLRTKQYANLESQRNCWQILIFVLCAIYVFAFSSLDWKAKMWTPFFFFLFRLKKEEEERERERKRQEKIQRREDRRKEREEKRRQKKIEKQQKEEEERMQYKIALEERRLLIAQRKLESLRILSELFERIKVSSAVKIILKKKVFLYFITCFHEVES